MSDTQYKIVILYSGGLDSFIMYHYAKAHYPDADIKCLFFDHGQAAVEAEIKALPDFVTVRKMDWLGDEIKPIAKKDDPFAGAVYIPGRNLIFGALAACQEIADEVWMGTVWDEDNPKGTDKNEKFRHDTSELLSYVLSPFIDGVKIRFPFVEDELTKEKMVAWALDQGVAQEDILKTVSCWLQDSDKPCGECKQCSKRMLVFGLNGFSEEYVVHPLQSLEQLANLKNYVDHALEGKVLNRDEKNVVDMIVRYFATHTCPDAQNSEVRKAQIALMDAVLKIK